MRGGGKILLTSGREKKKQDSAETLRTPSGAEEEKAAGLRRLRPALQVHVAGAGTGVRAPTTSHKKTPPIMESGGGKIARSESCYDSFSTWTFISAVTSRKIFTMTGYSPRALMGSRSWIWRLSILKPWAARLSAMSPEVAEPKS